MSRPDSTAPLLAERRLPGLDALDRALAFVTDCFGLLRCEEPDLDRFREVVLVLPAPGPVGVDPDVQEMVGRVESESGLSPRFLEVHVPAEELAVTSPLHVDRMRCTALVEHEPASVPVSFLVSPAARKNLGDGHPRPARPPHRRAGSDPENGSRGRVLDDRRGDRAEDPPGPHEPKEHLIGG
jgi:hypothetical protein